jgi:hypothetical protein
VDVAAWLRGLGLEHYEPAFRDDAEKLAAAQLSEAERRQLTAMFCDLVTEILADRIQA